MNGSDRGGDRLDSWKEIAAYLKRGARTVQRWEREEGLPVHRLVHDKLGSVYAYRPELDAWWRRPRGGTCERAPLAGGGHSFGSGASICRHEPPWPAFRRRDAEAAGCVSEQAHSGGRARLPQLVLSGHAHPAARAARGDVRNLFVLPRRRRHRRRSGPARARRREQLAQWRARHRRGLSRRAAAGSLPGLPQAVRSFDLQREDFIAIIDGMEMDVIADIRAPDRPTLDLYCDRVACAVGRLSVRVFGMAARRRHRARPSSRPRAAAHQYSARPRRGRFARPAVSAARGAAGGGHHVDRSARRCWRIRRSARPAPASSRSRKAEFRSGQGDHGAKPAPRRAGAAHHGRGLSHHPRQADRARLCAAARAGSPAARKTPPHRAAQSRVIGMSGTVHIIGAGLAGLSAALRLARARHAMSSCTRRPRLPAAAAAPITTPRSA